MDWVKLAIRYYADPKVRGLDDAAELMFVRGLARAGELGNGGFIPETDLGLLTRRRRWDVLARALVDARLWSRADGGYRVVAWADWQSAADALAARRQADRERQRKRRALRPHENGSRDIGNVSRDVTHAEGEGDLEVKGEDVARAAGGDRLGPPRTCPKHPAGTDDPCHPCRRAREAAEGWAAGKRARVAAGPKCKRHPEELARNCRLCRAERLGAA